MFWGVKAPRRPSQVEDPGPRPPRFRCSGSGRHPGGDGIPSEPWNMQQAGQDKAFEVRSIFGEIPCPMWRLSSAVNLGLHWTLRSAHPALGWPLAHMACPPAGESLDAYSSHSRQQVPERCARRGPGSPRSPAPGAGESPLWALRGQQGEAEGWHPSLLLPRWGRPAGGGRGLSSLCPRSRCIPCAHTCTHVLIPAHVCTHWLIPST